MIQELLTEKLRPKTLNQIVLVDRIKSQFKDGKLTQNYILEGGPGSGKTTLAKVLATGKTTLYINASEERGIDIIREKIINFCSCISIDLETNTESQKVIILDEIDGATEEFFKALRAVMDKFHTSRFICTCNYINKIPDPIQSRCNCISFNPIDEQEQIFLINSYTKIIKGIFEKFNIQTTDDVISFLIKNDFPDFRSILNKIQSLVNKGSNVITINDIKAQYDFSDLFELVLKESKPWENYKLIVSEYSTRVDEALNSFSKDFPKYMQANGINISKLPLVIICVAEHQFQKSFVIDPLVTLLSLVYKLQIIINS